MDVKTCTQCGATKHLDEFSPHPATRDRRQPHCKACQRERARRSRARNLEKYRSRYRHWLEENRETANAASRAWRATNPEKAAAAVEQWRAENPERARLVARRNRRIWAAKHPEQHAAYEAARRSAKRCAVPPWADLSAVAALYAAAQAMTGVTGVAHEVDHFVPLKHPLVCGLHCEANLRVVTAVENRRKGNRSWPGMWPALASI